MEEGKEVETIIGETIAAITEQVELLKSAPTPQDQLMALDTILFDANRARIIITRFSPPR